MSTKTTSFPKNKIKVLLLENIHPNAIQYFSNEGYQVELLKSALNEKDLCEKIKGVHVLGIRSKTQVTKNILKEANNLLTIGCFCIGTNQVDLSSASHMGYPVFNAPFSNTRSVAELILGEIIALARQLGDRSREVHSGEWKKVATSCYEVRGKTLGIVGYGHIGQQVAILAESLGMQVIFYDIVPKLPMGMVRSVSSLEDLLKQSDFVTLHVPETSQTKNMITEKEFSFIKRGSYLLNASRGTVVEIPALVTALKSGRLAGASIDVYPEEPEGNNNEFKTPLQNLPNVILTPHIGGSTEEAQANIGIEVASAIVKYVNQGATTGCVNFPVVDVPPNPDCHRILNIHQNVPGVLKDINKIVSDLNANIVGQTLATHSDIGYLVMDLDKNVSDTVKAELEKLKTSIRTRILY